MYGILAVNKALLHEMICLQYASLFSMRYHAQSSAVPAAEVLSELARAIDDSSMTRLNINRAQLWQCTKRAFCRTSYSPTHRMDVRFIDDIGVSEGAIDKGGPRREFLTLLCDHICHKSQLFCGENNSRHLTMIQDG